MSEQSPEGYRFNNARDAALFTMTQIGWANDSGGSSESPTGRFSRISNSQAEMQEVMGALEDELPAPVAPGELAGHFLVTDTGTSVTVDSYEQYSELIEQYDRKVDEFHTWLEQLRCGNEQPSQGGNHD